LSPPSIGLSPQSIGLSPSPVRPSTPRPVFVPGRGAHGGNGERHERRRGVPPYAFVGVPYFGYVGNAYAPDTGYAASDSANVQNDSASSDLSNQVQRLSQQIQDLQDQIAQKGPGEAPPSAPQEEASAAPVPAITVVLSSGKMIQTQSYAVIGNVFWDL